MKLDRRKMKKTKAFTLVEMMVAMVVLAIVMVVTFSILKQTSMMWLSSNAKLTSFEAATAGFDLLTRQLSQTTLNTYWDYNKDASGNYIYDKYVRASELHFCLGSGTSMLPSSVLSGTATPQAVATTQAVFFQAPLGYTATSGSTPDYSPLVGLLNTAGFYVAYTSQTNLPSFLNIAPTQRYRLYELLEPAEQLRIYNQPSGQQAYAPQDWFTTNLPTAQRKIADNVIGLILRARYPNPNDSSGTGYTDTYLYDSRDSAGYYDTTGQYQNITDVTAVPALNQPPPIVTATMIVIDEDSAKRLGTAYQSIGQPAGTFVDARLYATDLQQWETLLSNFVPKINYHVYNADITIRNAKWSSN